MIDEFLTKFGGSKRCLVLTLLSLKHIGEQIPPMIILASSGISTGYVWRYRGIISARLNGIARDYAGINTNERDVYARSVAAGQAWITTARERTNDDDDDRSGVCRSHNLVITSS